MTHRNDRIELLVSRIVVGEADDAAWAEFTSCAETDPALWRELAVAQRDQDDLARVVGAATAVADRVTVPEHALPDPLAADEPGDFDDTRSSGTAAGTRWRFPLLTISGWAAAAIVTLVAVVVFRGPGPERVPNEPKRIATIPGLTPDEALRQYLDVGKRDGRVVDEMPTRVLVDQRALPNGEYELLYMRQILESQRVPDLYQVTGQDETGRPTFVRYQRPTPGGM